jgi:hypothetical protein
LTYDEQLGLKFDVAGGVALILLEEHLKDDLGA